MIVNQMESTKVTNLFRDRPSFELQYQTICNYEKKTRKTTDKKNRTFTSPM